MFGHKLIRSSNLDTYCDKLSNRLWQSHWDDCCRASHCLSLGTDVNCFVPGLTSANLRFGPIPDTLKVRFLRTGCKPGSLASSILRWCYYTSVPIAHVRCAGLLSQCILDQNLCIGFLSTDVRMALYIIHMTSTLSIPHELSRSRVVSWIQDHLKLWEMRSRCGVFPVVRRFDTWIRLHHFVLLESL